MRLDIVRYSQKDSLTSSLVSNTSSRPGSLVPTQTYSLPPNYQPQCALKPLEEEETDQIMSLPRDLLSPQEEAETISMAPFLCVLIKVGEAVSAPHFHVS